MGANSEKWCFMRHPFRACSPNQSPLDRVVTATCSSLGELCWDTLTCREHRKQLFMSGLRVHLGSGCVPPFPPHRFFSLQAAHSSPPCLATTCQYILSPDRSLYLSIKSYNRSISFLESLSLLKCASSFVSSSYETSYKNAAKMWLHFLADF